jgi:hypothetical protein
VAVVTVLLAAGANIKAQDNVSPSRESVSILILISMDVQPSTLLVTEVMWQ